MEAFYVLLGLYMIYSWIHFFAIQHKKNYESRTSYEKYVTWVAIAFFTLIVLNIAK